MNPPRNTVVFSSTQDRINRNSNARRKQDSKLYVLQATVPALFAQSSSSLSQPTSSPGVPEGFKRAAGPHGEPHGWFYNASRQVYLQEATHLEIWLNQAGRICKLHHGMDRSADIELFGFARSAAAEEYMVSNDLGSKDAGEVLVQKPRSLVITDIHKAAKAFKLDLGHLDQPAAIFGLFGSAEGSVSADVAVKSLHEKLLKRLASYRSEWSSDALQAVLVELLSSLPLEHENSGGVAGIVALIFGMKLVTAATHGATCAVAEASGSDTPATQILVQGTMSAKPCAACVELDKCNVTCAIMQTDAFEPENAYMAAALAAQGRTCAGTVALLQSSAKRQCAPQPRAAACVHFARVTAGNDRAHAKRARIDTGLEVTKSRDCSQVRCRQILLKYVGCRQPTDAVRRTPTKRSLAEVEVTMLELLAELNASMASGGIAALDKVFFQQCRKFSECSSSLKAGDNAGDMGWLKLPELKLGEKVFSKEACVKLAVVRAVLRVEVGNVTDIVVTDDGVRLLKRTA